MKYSDAIEDFAGYAVHEKGYSPNTMRSQLARYRHFDGWLGEKGKGDPELHSISLLLVRSYIHSIRACPRTVRGAVGALRTFFDYFLETGAIDENPARLVGMPRKDAAERHLTSDDDLQALLDGVTRNPSTFAAARDTAVLVPAATL